LEHRLRLHQRFEWDTAKAEANVRKHGVSFGRKGIMRKKSPAGEPKGGSRTVRKSAGEIVPSTSRDLERLRRMADRDIDTSDIPERKPARAVRARRTREARVFNPAPSAIRDAIRRELGRRQITRYELWKRARALCPTLPESAVYEFLRGERQIGIEYVEALLSAVDLEVRRRSESSPDPR
jgi:hypothetical protein